MRCSETNNFYKKSFYEYFYLKSLLKKYLNKETIKKYKVLCYLNNIFGIIIQNCPLHFLNIMQYSYNSKDILAALLYMDIDLKPC